MEFCESLSVTDEEDVIVGENVSVGDAVPVLEYVELPDGVNETDGWYDSVSETSCVPE